MEENLFKWQENFDNIPFDTIYQQNVS